MQSLTHDQAKAVYRTAVDARASDAEGEHWWDQVQAELQEVAEAPDLTSAAGVIDWWHSPWEWQAVGDTAKAAAKRIRAAARATVN